MQHHALVAQWFAMQVAEQRVAGNLLQHLAVLLQVLLLLLRDIVGIEPFNTLEDVAQARADALQRELDKAVLASIDGCFGNLMPEQRLIKPLAGLYLGIPLAHFRSPPLDAVGPGKAYLTACLQVRLVDNEVDGLEIAVNDFLEDGVPNKQVVVFVGITAEVLKCLGKIFENKVVVLLLDKFQDVPVVILGIEFWGHHTEP